MAHLRWSLKTFMIVVILLSNTLFITSFMPTKINQYTFNIINPSQRILRMCSSSTRGQGFQKGSIPKPNVIVPSQGSQNPNLEKFLMMYTCKICSGRNAHMVSKVAYNSGMVVASCRHCKNKHLIADNENKLDFPLEYGTKIEDYLRSKGENVQKLTITPEDLENNYLIDSDGVLTLVPKIAGQPSADANIVEVPMPRSNQGDNK